MLSPNAAAAASASARSEGSTRPFHASAVPPAARSGAAYSKTTPSGASARAVTRSCDVEARGPRFGAGGDDRDVGQAQIADDALEERALARDTLDEGDARVRQRDCQREAGKPRPRAEIGDPSRLTHDVELERDEGVRDVHVDAALRVPDGGNGSRFGRDEVEERGEPIGGLRRQVEAGGELVEAAWDRSAHAVTVKRETSRRPSRRGPRKT